MKFTNVEMVEDGLLSISKKADLEENIEFLDDNQEKVIAYFLGIGKIGDEKFEAAWLDDDSRFDIGVEFTGEDNIEIKNIEIVRN